MFHVHVENASTLMPVFQVREDQYEKALAKHPDVAKAIRTTWGRDQDNWSDNAKTADAMITYRFPKERLGADAPKLKLLQILGAGVDYLLPLDWVPPGVIMLTNSGAHVPKAAQSGSMALMMLNARMPELVWSHRAHKWNRIFTTTLEAKTVLVVGVGAIGGGIAEHAKAAGMRVIGIRRPTIPRSCARMKASGASETAQGLARGASCRFVSRVTTSSRRSASSKNSARP